MEMSIDLQDAKIMGTDESVEQLDQITSSYQMRFNNDNYLANAYEICLNNTYEINCQNNLDTLSYVATQYIEWLQVNFKSKTHEEKGKVNDKLVEINNALKSKSKQQHHKLMHNYFMDG